MKIINKKNQAAEIEISKTELYALRQVFNEACHAIKIDNFEETIGISKLKAQHFFDYFNDLEKRISPGSSISHQIVEEKSKENNLEKSRKCYGLRSEKYDLGFYMQKLNTKSEIGFGIALQKKGRSEIITKISAKRVNIEQLHREITLLKEGINLFSHNTDIPTSYSFYNKAFKINLSAIEANNSESSDKSQLNIEFVFKQKKQIYSDNTPTKFTSITTLDNITSFVASVENFLLNIV